MAVLHLRGQDIYHREKSNPTLGVGETTGEDAAMVQKVVVSLVLAGSLAMGSMSMASAAPSVNCTNASAAIAHLQAQEAKVASLLSSLQAFAAHGGLEAQWLQFPIALLTRVEAALASEVTGLESYCSVGSGSGGGGAVAA